MQGTQGRGSNNGTKSFLIAFLSDVVIARMKYVTRNPSVVVKGTPMRTHFLKLIHASIKRFYNRASPPHLFFIIIVIVYVPRIWEILLAAFPSSNREAEG